MKFEVGDKVVVKHSNEEGDVIEILNEKMVLIDVRGVKFPAYTDQLDYPYFKRFSEKKLFPEKKPVKTFIDQVPKDREKVVKKTEQRNGVWLLMFPTFAKDDFGDEIVDALKIHLVNGTTIGYNFTYKVNTQKGSEFELSNQVVMYQDFYLHDLDFEKINDNPSVECEFSLITPDKKKATHYETILKLRPKQIFKKVEELKVSGDPSFSFKLFEQYPDQFEEETPSVATSISTDFKLYNASKARQHLDPPKFVIDLHMEKLSDDWKHLSNREIILIQLKEFEKYYDLAIVHHQPSLTVIHGIGSGRLKDEIHELLKHRKEVKTFVNQYHSSYGYGATEIYFQY